MIIVALKISRYIGTWFWQYSADFYLFVYGVYRCTNSLSHMATFQLLLVEADPGCPFEQYSGSGLASPHEIRRHFQWDSNQQRCGEVIWSQRPRPLCGGKTFTNWLPMHYTLCVIMPTECPLVFLIHIDMFYHTPCYIIYHGQYDLISRHAHWT